MYLGWHKKEEQLNAAYEKVDAFFEDLFKNGTDNINGINVAYREPQQRFASTVMEAIRDRKVLLIQAGVGTGKSFGYLIPIFYTMNNVTTFDKVVISTSTIALQEQLLKDIEVVSRLLGIKIKAWLSKGANNYACLKKINDKIFSAAKFEDANTIAMLSEIKAAMLASDTADKVKLPPIDADVWNDIHVSGSCCADCRIMSKCAYVDGQSHIRNMPIIVTNHAQLCNMIANNDSEVTGSSLLVVDEAHKLEEQIRLANQEILNFQDIIKHVEDIYYKLAYDAEYSYECRMFVPLYRELKDEIIELAKSLKSNARAVYRRQKNSNRARIEEVDKVNINLENDHIKSVLIKLCSTIEKTAKFLSPVGTRTTFENHYHYFSKLALILKDMSKGSESKKLYWVKFIDKHRIEIVFTIKDLSPYFNKIFGSGKPAIFTSATLTTNGNYDRFIQSTGIKDERLEIEYPIASPFDYENHSLFYYDPEAVSPTVSDRKAYIEDMAIRIRDLIEVTQGKALILFTSKNDMKDVYNIVKEMNLSQKLILQTSDDVNRFRSEFMEDEDSCLFATGAFWEGIDIPGKTLSNLIVVKLPFPVQDPVVEYKKGFFPKNESSKVDLDEMLMRMAQGTGRLIRSKDDIGVVCCLDSRVPKYLDYLANSLPFKRFTSDSSELIEFSNEKILETASAPIEKVHQLSPENKQFKTP